MQATTSNEVANGVRKSSSGDPAEVQLLKEWNIDRFFSRDDEKRHSTQSAVVPSAISKELTTASRQLERQVHREIISPRPKVPIVSPARSGEREKPIFSSAAAAPAPNEGNNFMKNFSFIKNFKREKSDLFPLSKRHSSEISYNVNVNKYISAGPQRSSVMEKKSTEANATAAASLLRAGPRREKTESVILRRNSTQVTAQQAEDARIRAMNNRPVTATEAVVANANSGAVQSINNQIDLKSNVAGEGGSRFYADQVISFNFYLSSFLSLSDCPDR